MLSIHERASTGRSAGPVTPADPNVVFSLPKVECPSFLDRGDLSTRRTVMNIGGRVATVMGVALSFAVPVHAADATGKWKAEFDSQVGVQKYTYDLKVEAGKLTGKASFERMGQKGEADLKDGKVHGDEVSFVEMLDFQGNQVSITYTGKLAGDEIKFTRKVGDFATEEFVAKRVKE
jgi:hypothetical protein